MASIRMEDLVQTLSPDSWSKEARDVLIWTKDSKPMLRAYASVLKGLFNWLIDKRYTLPVTSDYLSEYIVHKAESSPSGRPSSGLKQLKYAYRIYANALGLENFFQHESIKTLVQKSIQKFTKDAIQHVGSFHDDLDLLFEYFDRSWVPLETMDEKELRDRTIVLVSLCTMARPSDICAMTLLRKRVCFERKTVIQDGVEVVDNFFQLTLLGTKTDQKMDGRKVRVYSVSEPKRCPVLHLKQYMERTQDTALRMIDPPLFLSICSTVHPVKKGLKPDTIASIIKAILDQAGIRSEPGKPKITARSIRPTAATKAYMEDVSITDILDTGGWSVNSADLLRKHYLRPSRRNNISSAILT